MFTSVCNLNLVQMCNMKYGKQIKSVLVLKRELSLSRSNESVIHEYAFKQIIIS